MVHGFHETSLARLPESPAAQRSGFLEPVISAMRRHDSLSLHEMAETAHLSPHHFARTFRKATGIPPGEFMTALWLEKAKRLLLTTDLSVGEICFEVGYSSVGSFTMRFTQLVGLPPTGVRLLPEKLVPVQERIYEREPLEKAIGMDTATAGVAGRIEAPGLQRALIFAGLFSGAIPQRGPIAGVMLTAPGDFVVRGVPDGVYNLMAAAVPLYSGPQSLLLPDDALRVGRAEHLIQVRGGLAPSKAILSLRSTQPTDPPLLVPLAMLLLKQMNSTNPSNRAR